MARFWSTLFVLVACLAIVNWAAAQEKKGGKGQMRDPGERFDEMEKAVKHDPLKGELTKDEFIKAMKESGSRMADRAEEFYGRIKKADENKVTKAEYVAAMKELYSGGRKKKGG